MSFHLSYGIINWCVTYGSPIRHSPFADDVGLEMFSAIFTFARFFLTSPRVFRLFVRTIFVRQNFTVMTLAANLTMLESVAAFHVTLNNFNAVAWISFLADLAGICLSYFARRGIIYIYIRPYLAPITDVPSWTWMAIARDPGNRSVVGIAIIVGRNRPRFRRYTLYYSVLVSSITFFRALYMNNDIHTLARATHVLQILYKDVFLI